MAAPPLQASSPPRHPFLPFLLTGLSQALRSSEAGLGLPTPHPALFTSPFLLQVPCTTSDQCAELRTGTGRSNFALRFLKVRGRVLGLGSEARRDVGTIFHADSFNRVFNIQCRFLSMTVALNAFHRNKGPLILLISRHTQSAYLPKTSSPQPPPCPHLHTPR